MNFEATQETFAFGAARSPDEPRKRRRGMPDQDSSDKELSESGEEDLPEPDGSGFQAMTQELTEQGDEIAVDEEIPVHEEEEAAQEDERGTPEPADVEERRVELMPVVIQGMKQMAEHTEIIDKQLEKLAEEGLKIIEATRQAFIDTMNGVRGEFTRYQEDQRALWFRACYESQDTEQKLQQIARLVEHLNIQAGMTS